MKEKLIVYNRKAKHDYFLQDFYEAGMVLVGTEIKSIREGKVQIRDGYISIINNEVYIKNMNVSHYSHGNQFNHEELRERKLLLHRSEIKKLSQKIKQEGFTIVPIRIYLKGGKVKIEIATAKGKKLFDKRHSEKVKDNQRMIQRAIKNYR